MFATAAGAAAVIFLISRRTHVQLLTYDSLLGRASATFLGCEAAGTLAGTALGGVTAELAGLQVAVIGASVVMFASAGLAAVLLGHRSESR